MTEREEPGADGTPADDGKRRVILAAVSFVVCALLLVGGLEGVLRVVGDYEIRPDGSVVLLRPQDGSTEQMIRRYAVDGVDMWEYRDDRPRPEGPPKGRRVVGLGDSMMSPYDLDPEQGFFQKALARAEEARPGLELEGVNLSVGGFSIDQKRLVLKDQGLGFEPDVVLLQLWQDDEMQYRLVGDTLYMVDYVRQMQEERREETSALMRWLQQSYVWTWLELRQLRGSGQTDLDMQEEVRRIAALAEEHGARLAVVIAPDLSQALAAQDAKWDGMRAMLDEMGVPTLDLVRAVQWEDPAAVLLDPIHLNEAGHDRVAAVTGDWLAKDVFPDERPARGARAEEPDAETLLAEAAKQGPRRIEEDENVEPGEHLEKHQLCAAVASGEFASCTELTHHPGREGDCKLIVATKRYAAGDEDACESVPGDFLQAYCRMGTGQVPLDCDELYRMSEDFRERANTFESLQVFVTSCRLLEKSEGVYGICTRDLAEGEQMPPACMMAVTYQAWKERDPKRCALFRDRRSREMCYAILTDDPDACTSWIDYSKQIDPPWHDKE